MRGGRVRGGGWEGGGSGGGGVGLGGQGGCERRSKVFCENSKKKIEGGWGRWVGVGGSDQGLGWGRLGKQGFG